MTDLSVLVSLVLVSALRAATPAPAPPVPPPVPTPGQLHVAPAHAAVWPLGSVSRPPEVAAGFDPPYGPYGAGHRGVDLVGAEGEEVRAALPGTVSFAGTIAGRGVVVVEGGSTRTTYEPVTAVVHRGDAVGAGSALGSLQGGGSHCPPRSCLHWGLIAGETYLDPLSLMDAGPVRLLPVGPQARG